MDVHCISANTVNEIRAILPRKAIPSSDRIKDVVAYLNGEIKDKLGLRSGSDYAFVNARKTIVWLIQNGIFPDERRLGLLFTGDGKNTGRKMKFTGTTVLKLKDGRIVEEIGLDDGVAALTQLGLIKTAA